MKDNTPTRQRAITLLKAAFQVKDPTDLVFDTSLTFPQIESLIDNLQKFIQNEGVYVSVDRETLRTLFEQPPSEDELNEFVEWVYDDDFDYAQEDLKETLTNSIPIWAEGRNQP